MIREGLTLRINAVSLIATAFLLITFVLQHNGAARAAYVQKILGVACLAPLILVGLVPLITGDLPADRLFPLLPLVRDTLGAPHFGTWDVYGLTLLAGAMFGAGWSTYGFETAVCYTREFGNPARDTPRTSDGWRRRPSTWPWRSAVRSRRSPSCRRGKPASRDKRRPDTSAPSHPRRRCRRASRPV
jgi:hypothetical protein